MKCRRLALLVLAVSGTAFGFPEMIRNGYVNCTSCHMSPTGGGILTGYGRVQAEEVLSTWKYEGEGNVLHGAVGDTAPFSFGGQFRVIQTWNHDSTMRRGRFIFMQQDLEAGVTLGQFTAVATAGVQDRANPFVSRRHYALFRHSDESQWTLRAGKFLYAYGIHTPDHVLATKRGIGLGEGTETYNLEFSWLGEQYDVFATAIFGSLDAPGDQGGAIRVGRNLGDRSKVGLSAFVGQKNGAGRQLLGAYALLGFNEHFFLLAEADLQRLSAGDVGPASYARLDYEFIQGLHGYLSGEFSYLSAQTAYAAGLGVQWFPRPHFEFRLHYDRRRDALTSYRDAHYGWLMAHYYL